MSGAKVTTFVKSRIHAWCPVGAADRVGVVAKKLTMKWGEWDVDVRSNRGTGEVASACLVGPGLGVCGQGDWRAQVVLGTLCFVLRRLKADLGAIWHCSVCRSVFSLAFWWDGNADSHGLRPGRTPFTEG